MKKTVVVVAVVSMSLCWVWAQPAPGQVEAHPSHFVPGEIIICFRPNVPLPDPALVKVGRDTLTNEVLESLDEVAGIVRVERLAPVLHPVADRIAPLGGVERNGSPKTLGEVAAILSEFGQDRTVVVRLAAEVDVPQLARDLLRRYPDLIELAEPNYLRQLYRRPNDPLFSRQWHLVNVGAQQAWDETIGSSDVLIAVIDTGISSHVDLDQKRFINPDEIPGNGLDDDGNGFVDDDSGWDFLRRDNDPDDEEGHGTWVSGVAAAATDNRHDIAGMSWESRILPLKACCTDDGFFSDSGIIRAINYATLMAIHGVRIINMSFGGPDRSGGMVNAIRAANAAHILCVAAAGNEAGNNDEEQSYPSGFEVETDNLIGVASTGRRDRLSGFSNYGLSVGVAAPGERIVTTSAKGKGTASVSGTSFSAPLVAGVAALIYSQFPQESPLQVRGRIEGNVDETNALRNKVLSGGRVNAAGVFEIDDIPPAPITDLRLVEEKQGLTLAWTAPGDDGTEDHASFYDIRYLRVPITNKNFRYTKKLLTTLRPGNPGSTEMLVLPEDFPTGRFFFLIRVLDNAGNLAESNQIEVRIE